MTDTTHASQSIEPPDEIGTQPVASHWIPPGWEPPGQPSGYPDQSCVSGVRISRHDNLSDAADAYRLGDHIVIFDGHHGLDDDFLTRTLPGAFGWRLHSSQRFDPVREIRPDPSDGSVSVATSMLGHPAHVDGCWEADPPVAFVLSCVSSDGGVGGRSLAWSVDRLLEFALALPHGAEHLDALWNAPVDFTRHDPDGTSNTLVAPMLSAHGGESLLRWRADHQVWPRPVGPHAEGAARAIEVIVNFLNTGPRAEVDLESGETMIVNNRRVLHGRMPLTHGSSRWVRRVWFEEAR